MYLGIDVSNNQGHIDWPMVAQSLVSHVAMKTSEGTSFHDDYYHANIQACQTFGLGTMAYHFGRPSRNSGHLEAEFFLSLARHSPEPNRYCLDLEDDELAPDADLAAYTLDFLQTVEGATGKIPTLYTSHGYARDHKLHLEPGLARFSLWIASWQTLPPMSFDPFSGWDGWQFTDAGYTPGVGAVDQSLWRAPW
jgi:lysozyme